MPEGSSLPQPRPAPGRGDVRKGDPIPNPSPRLWGQQPSCYQQEVLPRQCPCLEQRQPQPSCPPDGHPVEKAPSSARIMLRGHPRMRIRHPQKSSARVCGANGMEELGNPSGAGLKQKSPAGCSLSPCQDSQGHHVLSILSLSFLCHLRSAPAEPELSAIGMTNTSNSTHCQGAANPELAGAGIHRTPTQPEPFTL